MTPRQQVIRWLAGTGVKVDARTKGAIVLGHEGADWVEVFETWPDVLAFLVKARNAHQDESVPYPWERSSNPKGRGVKRAQSLPSSSGQSAYKTYLIRWSPNGIWVEKGGVHIGWFNSQDEARKAIDYLAADLRGPNPSGRVRIVHNKLLGGWFVVRGPQQTPLSGRFDSKAQAQAWLDSRKSARQSNPAGWTLTGRFEGFPNRDLTGTPSRAPVPSPATVLERGKGKRALIHVHASGRDYYGWVDSERLTYERSRKSNPVPPLERERAAKLFERFTGHRAVEVSSVDWEPPSAVMVAGEVNAIDYDTVRDGRFEKYRHRFKKSARPLLCVTHDGLTLIVLGGGRFRFGARGIVDRE